MLFLGQPGCGKTTLSYMLSHCADQHLQQVHKHNLQYYTSKDIFFAGRNSTDIKYLSSYHINFPEKYIIQWLDDATRPKIFVGDGDRFADIKFWKPLVEKCGLTAVFFCCMAGDDITQQRREHRGRFLPNNWANICNRFQQLEQWTHPSIQNIKLNTQETNAFTILTTKILPSLHLSSTHNYIPTTFTKSTVQIFELSYEVLHNFLPNHLLQFLHLYAQQALYFEEVMIVNTLQLHLKGRGVQVEGNPDCGLQYKSMILN